MGGTSKSSIPSEVKTASPNDAGMAATRSGVCPMLSQALSVRGAVSVTPRVENSNMAPIGRRKKAPSTRKTATRKICSLSRRLRLMTTPSPRRSLQPPRRPPLQHRVQHHHDRDDDNHYQGQRGGDPRVRQADLAGERIGDQQRSDDAALVDQGCCGWIGRVGSRGWDEPAAGELQPPEPSVAGGSVTTC